MKKAILMFCMAMSLFASNVFAQEVRGVSTRRVIYESDNQYDADKGGKSGRYYGWEVTNNNSISISVDIYLYKRGAEVTSDSYTTQIPPTIVKTQSITLKSGESYIFKNEDMCATRVDKECPYLSGYDNNVRMKIQHYYLEYKAYKLQ